MAKKKVQQATPARTVFVVMRDNWRHHGGWRRGIGQFRLASFDSAEKAEADRARREESARRRLNPFQCGDELSDLTSYPETVFLDWVQDAGLTPPEAAQGKRDWAAWWDEAAPKAGADQRARIWQAMDRVRFYHVVERPAWAVGYVAVAPIWEESVENTILTDEGGEVLAVHRTMAAAYEEAGQAGYSDGGDRWNWFPCGWDVLDPETHWLQYLWGHPTCDVVEIDLEGVAEGGKARSVWLVVRRAESIYGLAEQERVPVRGFADRLAAVACRRELEDDFRRRYDVWTLFDDRRNEGDYEAFFAAARRLGMPRGGNQDSASWWREHGPGLSAEQRQALWEGVSAESDVFEVIERRLLD
jgi:hypothetical protein